ncbi:MAG: nicotinate-nucleotide diphosphorylase (carboxylating) [Verrucomicrobia bacterium A1]|nr:MAG: nicotinate-nucleotide diphosphorylase (carboxylating) [Verrucomicrobia bacterium A1]
MVRAALREDIGRGDATTRALVPAGARTRAAIVARNACVVCGTAVAREVFRQVDPRIRCTVKRRDGAEAVAGDTLVLLEGPARGVLTAERTALNFMQRMTGIATLTREFVRRAAPHGAAILDTRKTTPGLRTPEKYAVKCGGGTNHRFGLFDRVLIKDNHRAFWAGRQERSLADAVRAARARYPRLVVEIEVESEAELHDALEARPDWVLLDNMTPVRLRRCVKINAGRAKLEASGGVTLDTVARIAATGVDAISVGALTHSAPAADLSLEFL